MFVHAGGMETEWAGTVVGVWLPAALQPAPDASHSSLCTGSDGLAQAPHPQHTSSTQFGGTFTPSLDQLLATNELTILLTFAEVSAQTVACLVAWFLGNGSTLTNTLPSGCQGLCCMNMLPTCCAQHVGEASLVRLYFPWWLKIVRDVSHYSGS